MKIETKQTTKITLSELDGLDPITVILENYEPGKGKIIIECFAKSWTSYWGAMSGDTVESFFCRCGEDYLACSLAPGINSDIEDLDGLANHARRNICSERRKLELTKNEAREQFNLAERLNGIENLSDVAGEMHQIFGDNWWYAIPLKPNPRYQYLCRIIKAVQQGLNSMASDKAA